MSKPHSARVAARPVAVRRRRLIAEALEGRRLLVAPTPVLLGDINQTTDQLGPDLSVQVGNGAFFAGRRSAADGPELFRTDGTTAGTVLVKDINPTAGSDPSSLTRVGNLLYFDADDGTSGVELWKSDGTAAGTVRVADLSPGLDSGLPSNLLAVGNTLFFTASDGNATTLWQTDGTAAGTTKIKDSNGGALANVANLAASNGNLFFAAGGSSSSGRSVYELPSSGGGAVPVVNSPVNVSNLTAFGGYVYFTRTTPSIGSLDNGDLWRASGLGAEKVVAIDVNASSFNDYATVASLTASGDELFLLVGNVGTGSYDLWSTNGTPGVAPIHLTTNAPFSRYSTFAPIGTRSVFFTNTTTAAGREPWVSDGSIAGTALLKDLAPGGASGATYLTGFATLASGRSLFTTSAAFGLPIQVWTTDGTAANTVQGATIQTAAGVGYTIGSLNGVALINGERGVGDGDLYRSDATAAGTYRIGATGIGTASSLSYAASSYGPEFTAIGNSVYFAASDGASGYELWRAVGDAAPQRVVDLATGGADAKPANITAGGDGSVYFTINPPAGTRTAGVYWIDKTGKLTVVPISPPDGTVVSGSLVAFGSRLLFKMTAGGQYARGQLWMFDPAVGHAQPVIAESAFLDASNVVIANGYALFGAVEFSSSGTDTSKQRLFRLGTTATVAELVTTFAASANGYTLSPSPVGVGGAIAYFEIDTATLGDELYAVGTSAGGATTASLVRDLSPGAASTDFNTTAPQSTAYAAGAFYFSAQTSADTRYRVYRTDGTAAGTRAIGTGTSSGNDLSVDAPSFVVINDGTNVGQTVYFVGKLGSNPDPLLSLITSDGAWYTSGRYGDFVPYALVGAADTVYSIGVGGAARDRFDLWRMAGVNAGAPALVATLAPKLSQQIGGELLSFWSYGRYAMAATDTNLFFPTYSAATGIEPGRLALAATPEPHMQTGTVAEGGTMQVGGADIAYSSPEDRLRYEWDFNYDGTTFDVDATGSKPIFSAANVDGTTLRTIALRITNGGNRSAIATGVVTIVNVAPTATLTGTAGYAGANSTFAFGNVVDPGLADTAAGFTYSFDLDGDGAFTGPGEVDRGASPTFAHAFATPGQYTVVGRVYDKDGSYTQYRRAVTVDAAPAPAPPTKVGFDNYGSVVEGSSTTLYGHATVASGQSIAKWEYDFDYNGTTFDVDATGQLPTFVAPDGPATRTIAVRVTDNFGQSVIAKQTLNVLNADPTATFVATISGNTATATFANPTDPAAADRASGFKYSFDFDGDGYFTSAGDVANSASPTASFTFAAVGAHTIHGLITDKDGGLNYYTTSVTTAPPPPPANVGFDTNSLKEGGPPAYLIGRAATVAGQSIVKYEWDFDYVNNTFTSDYTSMPSPIAGGTASFNYSAYDGPASPTLALRVTDNYGQVVTVMQVVPIANVAPTATLTSSATGLTATATFANATDASAADRAAGFRYSFDFNNDGDFLDSGDVLNSTSPTASFAFKAAGTYSIRGRIADKDGGLTDYTTNVAINVTRPAPPTNVGFSGGPVAEGHAQALAGLASLAAGQSIVKWEYDFNYDGKTFDVDATGPSPTFDASNIDGTTTRLIGVRVTDNYGQIAIGSQTLTIVNLPPAATFGVIAGSVGGTAVASFTKAGDDGVADFRAGFTYSFDFNNDGDFTDPGEVDRGTSPTATGTYAAAGTYTVLGRIYDKDGDSSKYVASVTVLAPPPKVYPPSPSFTGSSVNEGGTLALNGFVSTTSGYAIAKWEYDFDYVNNVFTTDATTQNATFDATNLDGPTTRQVAIRVTDDHGLVGLRVQTVSVLNVNPTATLNVVANASGSATATFANAADFSAADRAAGFKYSFDFNGDGDFDDVGDVKNSTSPTATFAFAKSGTYPINAQLADKDGGVGSYAKAIAVTVPTTTPTTPVPLTGTPIGTSGSYQNAGDTIAKAFDGDLATFFDGPAASGNVVGLDLGAAKVIAQIQYAPRVGYAARMVGGIFQGSNDAAFATTTTLYTITATPVVGSLTTVTISNANSYRYVRYVSPAGSYGDVAELKFFGPAGTTTTPPVTTPTKLIGTPIGTSGSYQNAGNTIAKAFDGDLATFFDGPGASGNVAGLDLGAAKVIAQIQYAPRVGYAARMVGGLFQGSNDAAFAAATTLYTITATPAGNGLTTATITNAAAYRYVRYVSPAGSYGDVAELQFFGTDGTTPPPVVVPPPVTTPTKLSGTTIGTLGSYQNSGNTIAKAIDGDLASYYDGAAADGNWIGLDLGTARPIAQVAYAPRAGYGTRMVGGLFQGSNTADFSVATTLLTITAAATAGVLTTAAVTNATAFRYVRYLAPAGSYGNAAEIAFYG